MAKGVIFFVSEEQRWAVRIQSSGLILLPPLKSACSRTSTRLEGTRFLLTRTCRSSCMALSTFMISGFNLASRSTLSTLQFPFCISVNYGLVLKKRFNILQLTGKGARGQAPEEKTTIFFGK